MLDDLFSSRLVVLQHVFDQVDPAAGAIEFIAKKDEGRAGRGAKAAMDAIAQDLFRSSRVRIRKLGEREIGLHRSNTRIHTARIENPFGIEALFDPFSQCSKRRWLRMKDGNTGANTFRCPDQGRVSASGSIMRIDS